MKISIISPVYRAEGCIRELYRRVKEQISTFTDEYECIFVEDCGGDESWTILSEIAASDRNVKAIQFSRNFGQHYAITAGLEACTGDWAVVMDCDLQDRPEEIPRLYAKVLEGYDIVCARRGKRKDPIWKTIASRLFVTVFRRLSDMDYDPEIANFRILSRKVIDAYCSMSERLRFFGGHLQWLGFSVGYIDVEHGKRHEGGSSYTFKKLFKLAMDTIIAYSDKPLRISIKVGFLMALLSFIYAVFLIYRKFLQGVPVEGWTSLMVSVWFLGGMVIANLGIIGIYLGKVYDETKKRPLYVISKRVNL